MREHPHLERLIETMATLRSNQGCQWDREQDHHSLIPFLLEEVHELIDAIEAGSPEEMKEELGDVLYQLLFHADIAQATADEGFGIDDVARATDEKMRRRHPHVFGEVTVTNVSEITDNWREIKKSEKPERQSALDGVPRSLSGLARAEAVLHRAEREGLVVSPNREVDLPESDFGDWLLAVIQTARARGLSPERELREALRVAEHNIRAEESSRLSTAVTTTD